MYKEDDFLMLSGIQHFAFCRRQWALIHIEQQWVENFLTTDGNIFHKNAHNALHHEKRNDLLIVRGLKIQSFELGLSGNCDVVEFQKSESGISLAKYDGLWMPYPVEYKRGKSKDSNVDEVQLCAQAMCLEEMLLCNIPEGSLFYGETKKRQRVIFDDALRNIVKDIATEMHKLFKAAYTPKAKKRKHCNSCSLQEICMPQIEKYYNGLVVKTKFPTFFNEPIRMVW